MDTRRVRLEEVVERSLPYMFSLQFVLGSLQLLDALRVVYYPLIHGATRIMRFELSVSFIWPLLLLIIVWVVWVIWRRAYKLLLFPTTAIIVLPFLGIDASISIASLQAVVAGLWYCGNVTKFLTGFFLLFSGIEGMALLHWIVFLPLGLTSPFTDIVRIETGIFYLSAYLVPFLVLMFFFIWIIKPIIRWGIGSFTVIRDSDETRNVKHTRGPFLLLVFSIIIAIIAALYPHWSGVNPEGLTVGVDFDHYVIWAEMVENEPSLIYSPPPFNFSQKTGGSRPFMLLFTYCFQKVIRADAFSTIKYLPVLLIPLLVISTYFFTMEGFQNAWLAGWAAFFTVCGIQVSVGMYAYFLTNLLGLSLLFFSLGFLFKALRIGSVLDLASACILGGLLVFTHPWTFDQYLASFILTSCLVLYESYTKSKVYLTVRMIFMYVISLCIAELIKVVVFKGVGGVSASSNMASNLSWISGFWYDSIFSFRLLYGGTMSFAILIGFSVVGLYLMKFNTISEKLLTILTFSSSLVYLIGNETIKSRLLFNMPIGIFAAYGFTCFFWENQSEKYIQLIHLYTIINMLNYLFRSLVNFV